MNVALVPVGGGGGLNVAKAAEVISLLEPNIVIPMHYATPEAKVALDSLQQVHEGNGTQQAGCTTLPEGQSQQPARRDARSHTGLSARVNNVPVKVIMTWDIAAEHEQEYFEFVIGEGVPGVQRLGFQPIDAWATVFGAYPQIQVGLLADDAPKAREMMGSQDWGALEDRLLTYVNNYSYKVVSARGGFQF